MTRINVVPVVDLMDQHVQAEYFELPRIFKLVSNHWLKDRKPEDLNIPDAYSLGEGHMRFFYDKLLYLQQRHQQLFNEGTRRSLNLQVDPDVGDYFLPPKAEAWWNDYTPTPEAIRENQERIAYKISLHPQWYRYEGIPFNHFT